MLSPADGKKDFSHYTLFLKHLYPLLCSFFNLFLPISMHTRFTHLVIHLMALHILHNTHAYHHPSIPNFLIFFPTIFSLSTPHIHFFLNTRENHFSHLPSPFHRCHHQCVVFALHRQFATPRPSTLKF